MPAKSSKPIVLYHNPKCGTSRNVLALLQEKGVELQVVEYLKSPLQRSEWATLIGQSQLPAREFLRRKEPLYAELDLDNPKWTEAELIDFLTQHPALLNRPVVKTPKGIQSCRPAETVLALL